MKHKILSILLVLVVCSAAFSQQLTSIKDVHGNELLLQLNQQTGSAHRLFGQLPNISTYGFQSEKINQTSIQEISQKFFSDYSKILKIDPQQLKLTRAETDGKLWFVSFSQSKNGVPVYGTEIGYTVNMIGNVVALGADAYQDISVSTTPTVTKSNAEYVAKKAFEFDSTVTERECELLIFPKEEKDTTILYLTWKITLFRPLPLKETIYFIDAQKGTIIDQRSNLIESSFSGQVTGSYWPVHTYDQTVQSGFKSTHIKVYNYLGQMVWDGNSDDNGNYSTGNYSYTYYYIQFTLQNDWVQSRDASDAAITYTTGWYTPGATVNQNWGATDGTSVRWLASAMHDYFKNTFSYSSMDYQMGASVNKGSGYNGASDGTNIMFGSQSGQYWARSSDVVSHEYTHNTVYHIYSGWIGGGGNDYYSEGAAMDEGFSDYFACTKNNDPTLGEDVGISRTVYNNYLWRSDLTKYYNCQVIGGSCWDLRQSSGVGITIGDNLVFRALQISPHAHTFTDFETNVMIADENYYSGSHRSQIFQSFANHGIFTSYGAPSQPKNLRITNTSASNINLAWNANPEPDIAHYEVWRNVVNMGTGWQSIATTTSTSYTDPDYMYAFNFGNDQLQYKIRTKDNSDNLSPYSDIVSATGEPNGKVGGQDAQQQKFQEKDNPEDFTFNLSSSFPNPFNPTTTIRYSLAAPGNVRLTVYDYLGREVAVLIDGYSVAGRHEVKFDGSNVSSGIYFYTLTSGKNSSTKKFVLMK